MEPSAPQQVKYNKFLTLPDHMIWLACAAEVAESAGLDWDDLGTRWGITVCAEKTSTVRLNVGNRVLLDIRPDGAMNLFIVHSLNEPADWAGEVDVYSGFEQVKDSLCLVASDPDTLLELLEFEDIPQKLQLHAEASGRALPRPEWHNPLVEQLIFDANEDDEDDPDLDEDDPDDPDDEDDDDEDEDDPDDPDDPDDEDDDDEDEDDEETIETRGPVHDHSTKPQAGAEGLVNEQIIELAGRGPSKSRPFEVPRHAEFFVVRWTSGDKDTHVSVNGVPPTGCYESFRGRQGDGVVYETGRFYLEVDSDTEWTATVVVHFANADTQPAAGTIGSFTGHGPGKTRPFIVPKGNEYFVVTWTTTDEEMEVEVNGIDPTSSYDRFRGGMTGEGLVYESGRFYAEVETEGNWTLSITTE